uniref:Uncharacterized protein n=1 Tax=Emiliania huxleyi TaxID=2903 RepID=A0A7S3RQ96_EMIHU
MRRTSPPGKKLSTLPRIESSTVGLDSIEAAADAEHRAAARREMPGGPAWREAAERASAGGSCELALIERGLDDADVIALVASLQREAAGSALTGSRPINNVTSLDLRGNAIGDAGAAALSGLLRGEGCAICTLRLWGNRIGDEGGAALVSALARPNSSLTSLDLGKQGQPVGDAVAAALASSLPRCACPLQTLDLRYCGMTDKGALPLAAALPRRRALRAPSTRTPPSLGQPRASSSQRT